MSAPTAEEILRQRLRAVSNLPENQVCCDCGDKKPTWASIVVPPEGSPAGTPSMGAFCCFHCSGAHRRLGVHICFVRSVTLDVWKETEVIAMERGGNSRINRAFEAKLPPKSSIRPTATSNLDSRDQYIKLKYREQKYLNSKLYQVGPAVPSSGTSQRSNVSSSSSSRPKMDRRRPGLGRQNSVPVLSSTDVFRGMSREDLFSTSKEDVINQHLNASFSGSVPAFVPRRTMSDVARIETMGEGEGPMTLLEEDEPYTFTPTGAKGQDETILHSSDEELEIAPLNDLDQTPTKTKESQPNESSREAMDRRRRRRSRDSTSPRSHSQNRSKSRSKSRSRSSRSKSKSSSSRRTKGFQELMDGKTALEAASGRSTSRPRRRLSNDGSSPPSRSRSSAGSTRRPNSSRSNASSGDESVDSRHRRRRSSSKSSRRRSKSAKRRPRKTKSPVPEGIPKPDSATRTRSDGTNLSEDTAEKPNSSRSRNSTTSRSLPRSNSSHGLDDDQKAKHSSGRSTRSAKTTGGIRRSTSVESLGDSKQEKSSRNTQDGKANPEFALRVHPHNLQASNTDSVPAQGREAMRGSRQRSYRSNSNRRMSMSRAMSDDNLMLSVEREPNDSTSSGRSRPNTSSRSVERVRSKSTSRNRAKSLLCESEHDARTPTRNPPKLAAVPAAGRPRLAPTRSMSLRHMGPTRTKSLRNLNSGDGSIKTHALIHDLFAKDTGPSAKKEDEDETTEELSSEESLFGEEHRKRIREMRQQREQEEKSRPKLLA